MVWLKKGYIYIYIHIYIHTYRERERERREREGMERMKKKNPTSLLQYLHIKREETTSKRDWELASMVGSKFRGSSVLEKKWKEKRVHNQGCQTMVIGQYDKVLSLTEEYGILENRNSEYNQYFKIFIFN